MQLLLEEGELLHWVAIIGGAVQEFDKRAAASKVAVVGVVGYVSGGGIQWLAVNSNFICMHIQTQIGFATLLDSV
jgi:hypothetical protein